MNLSRDQVISTLRKTAALRELNASPAWRRVPVGPLGSKPIALVYGNCQAEAIRKILLTHPSMARTFHLLRVPAVHEISPRELGMIHAVLPRVEVLITQEIKPDYREMRLGTEQIVDQIASNAMVIRYPVAYFEGVYPFHVYINREGEPTGTSAPLTDYHDLRLMHAAQQRWDAPTTLRWLDSLRVDPSWVRSNAQTSLAELARREAQLHVQISDMISRPENLTTGFHTINHPANLLVAEMARQVLAKIGYADAFRVLDSTQTYLDHLKAPREPQILRALGAEPDPHEPTEWRTSTGTHTPADVVRAHLALYASDPALLAAGLAKHRERLRATAAAWE